MTDDKRIREAKGRDALPPFPSQRLTDKHGWSNTERQARFVTYMAGIVDGLLDLAVERGNAGDLEQAARLAADAFIFDMTFGIKDKRKGN